MPTSSPSRRRPLGRALVACIATVLVPLTACTDRNSTNERSTPSKDSTPHTTETAPTPETQSPTPPPTSSQSPQPNDCKETAPFSGDAPQAFGAGEVMDAFCTMLRLQLVHGLNERLLRLTPTRLTAADFSVWTRYMTPTAQRDWRSSVNNALHSDNRARDDVWSLAFYYATGSGAPYQFTEEPGVLNKRFTQPVAGTDTDGQRQRLVLKFSVTADLNLVATGTNTPHYLVPISREITLALIPNETQPDKRWDWLIDSWKGQYEIGKPVQQVS